jgi:tetratricopeptide (TPR) repeat protein
MIGVCPQLDLHVWCSQPLHNRGLCYLELKDYKKALSELETALSKGEASADIYNSLGLALFKNDKGQDAVDMFFKVMDCY